MTNPPADTTVTLETTDTSKGIGTTEFWKGLLTTAVAGFVVVWATVRGDRELMEWGMTAMVVQSTGYTAARTFLKR